MAQLKIDVTITDSDIDTSDSAPTYTKTITYTSGGYNTYVLPITTVKSIWDTDTAASAAVEVNSDFDALVIKSDQDIWIELVGTLSDNGADDVNIVKQGANLPFILTTDDTINGYTTADGLGSIANTAVIQRIRIYNASSTTTANVRVGLWT